MKPINPYKPKNNPVLNQDLDIVTDQKESKTSRSFLPTDPNGTSASTINCAPNPDFHANDTVPHFVSVTTAPPRLLLLIYQVPLLRLSPHQKNGHLLCPPFLSFLTNILRHIHSLLPCFSTCSNQGKSTPPTCNPPHRHSTQLSANNFP